MFTVKKIFLTIPVVKNRSWQSCVAKPVKMKMKTLVVLTVKNRDLTSMRILISGPSYAAG